MVPKCALRLGTRVGEIYWEPKCYADAKIQRQARCLPEQEIITFGYPMALHGARRKLESTDENTGTASQKAQTRGKKRRLRSTEDITAESCLQLT